jgi:hypothetical protein
MANQELSSVILVHDTELHPFGIARRFEVATLTEAVLGQVVAIDDERMRGNVIEYERDGVNCEVRFTMEPGMGARYLEDYYWTIEAVARVLGL